MNKLLVGLSAAATSAVLSLGTASAAPIEAPAARPRTVEIVGGSFFSPDEFFTETFRFTPRRLTVQHGATVTWDNKTTDGHTISVVASADVPKTADQVMNCAICNQVAAAHFPNGFGPQAQPVLFLDDFKPGTLPAKFDSVGDSLLVAPPGIGAPTSVSAQITAPAGTTLNYICAIHPWMQATIRVTTADDD